MRTRRGEIPFAKARRDRCVHQLRLKKLVASKWYAAKLFFGPNQTPVSNLNHAFWSAWVCINLQNFTKRMHTG